MLTLSPCQLAHAPQIFTKCKHRLQPQSFRGRGCSAALITHPSALTDWQFNELPKLVRHTAIGDTFTSQADISAFALSCWCAVHFYPHVCLYDLSIGSEHLACTTLARVMCAQLYCTATIGAAAWGATPAVDDTTRNRCIATRAGTCERPGEHMCVHAHVRDREGTPV